MYNKKSEATKNTSNQLTTVQSVIMCILVDIMLIALVLGLSGHIIGLSFVFIDTCMKVSFCDCLVSLITILIFCQYNGFKE